MPGSRPRAITPTKSQTGAFHSHTSQARCKLHLHDKRRKKHDIATRCPWVNYVSPPLNVVRGEVEMDDLVVIYEVLIQQYEVSPIAIKMMGAFDCFIINNA